MNENTRPAPRKFDREFQWAALDLWRTSGKTQKAVAAELGISDTSLRDGQKALGTQGQEESRRSLNPVGVKLRMQKMGRNLLE